MYLVAPIYVVWLFVHESYFLNINLRLLDGLVIFCFLSSAFCCAFYLGYQVMFISSIIVIILSMNVGRLGRSTRNLNVEISLMVVSFAMLFNGVSQHCWR